MRDIPAVQGRPAGSSPWHWAGLVSAPMEWGIIAGRFVVLALLVLMVALVDDLAAARPAAFGASAVALAYGSLLALALRAGRTRQVLLIGIGLDAITATAGLTLATFLVAGDDPAALAVAAPGDSTILVLLAATASLRLRLRPAVGFGVLLTLAPAALAVAASDGGLDASDFALRASRVAAAAVIFTFVGLAFQRTRRELEQSVSDQASFYAQARRQAREQEALAATGQAIGSSLDIEEVYERFAERVRALLPFDRAAIATVDWENGTLRTSYVAGLETEALPTGRIRPITAGGTFEEVARTGRPLRVSNLPEALGRFPDAGAAVEAGIRSGVYVPLLSDGLVIGTLAVCSVDLDAYTDGDLVLLGRVGEQIASAIANAELHSKVDRQAREEAVLAEIGRIISSGREIDDVYERFATQVGLLMPFDRLTIGTLGPGPEQLTVAHTSGTVMPGWEPGSVHDLQQTNLPAVYEARSVVRVQGRELGQLAPSVPLLQAALSAGLGSGLVAPLVSGDEVIGVLAVRSSRDDAYGEADEALVERVAAQIAGAVANAQLRAQLQREGEDRAVLAEIGRIVGSSLDLDEVYAAFEEQVRRLIEFDRITITYIDSDAGRAVYGWAAGTELAGVGRGREIPLEAFRGTRLGEVLESATAAILDEREISVFLARLPGVDRSAVRSMIAVPLVSADTVIGGLSIASRDAHAFSERDLASAVRVGRQVAGAVANTRLHTALQQASEELRESVAQKTNLISTVAHELRSPLTSLRAYVDLVLDEAAGEVPPRQRELLQRASRSTLRLQSLLGEFSHLEMAEDPSIELSVDSVDLGALAASAREVLEPAAEEAGVAIALLGFETLPRVEADAQVIEQVFSNLLSNAIKYSPDGGRVEVRAEANGDEVSVSMRDEGLGISPEDQQRLFERFFRGSDPAKLRVRGTGLGLYVSRGLVERHGGRMAVESTLGAGSTFRLTLPVRQARGNDGEAPG